MNNSLLHSFITSEENDELIKVKLDLIDPNPDQDRSDWSNPDTIDHIKSISISIGSMGDVSDPIKIIPSPSLDGRYILVDGECRLKAAEMAGLVEISAFLKKKLSAEQASIEALQTQTNKLALKPIAMANALKKRLDSGWDISKLKKATGRSDAWLSKRISLLDMPNEVKQVAEDGIILDPDNLKKIAKLNEKDRIEFIENLRDGTATMKDIKKGKVTKTKSSTQRKTRITVSEDDANLIISSFSNKENIDNIPLTELWKKFILDLKSSPNDSD